MAGMIARKPAAGIIAGLLFAGLGLLLEGIEGSRTVARVLFSVSAWFFLAIGVLSVSAGIYALLAGRASRRDT